MGEKIREGTIMDGRFYKLENGNYMRICGMCDDPECEFGYDYFDGKTKRIIDGGVFNLDEDDERTVEMVLKTALEWCDLDPNTGSELEMEDCEYSDLEEMGFTGF